MMRIWTTGDCSKKYQAFIDECVNALFDKDANYDIEINLRNFIDNEEVDKGTQGICTGDRYISTIEVATQSLYECGEEYSFQSFEVASTIAHELTHARQFHKGQINMMNMVWDNGKDAFVNCTDLNYVDQPWEVEAYAYEAILSDIFWDNGEDVIPS